MTARPYVQPVFIVGLPRSGTTLLQSILCANGPWFPIPETHFFSYAATGDPTRELSADERRGIAERVAERMPISPGDLDDENSATPVDMFLRIIDRQNAAGLDTFLEKTPRHAFCVSRIRRVFPDARFVCLVREPRNFAASNLEAFGADQSIIRLAALYSKIAGEIAGVRDRNWAHVVRYETLAGAPDECIAEICAFLDVEFRPESLTSFGAAADRVISPGETWKHRVAEAGAVGSDDAERWRSALTPAQGALVSWLTRGAATAFGYQPTIQMGAALTGLAADLPRALHPHQFARLFSRLDG